MSFYTYILHSKSLNRYYIGSTENLEMRLKEHLWKHKGYTSKANDWKLMYSESFSSKLDALARERQIKRWKSRVMIEKLIGS